MTKLNQILAIESGVKKDSQEKLTSLHKSSQKSDLYNGRNRRYSPKDDDGEQLPDESQAVQLRSDVVLQSVQEVLSELFDITFTKDVANTKATADIEVDGTALLSDVPVTYLLFLEKQLTDLNTFVKKLPVLDPSETWEWDEGQGAYRTSPTETAKTKKILRAQVLYEATKEHPAQVSEYTEDVVVGYWKTIKYSGAVSQSRKDEILGRIDKVRKAVKFARENANLISVEKQKAADAVFGYIFSR